MNIGFFADDASACHAALLANNALCREGGILAGGHRIADAVPAYLDEAAGDGRHLMVALPLAQLGSASIRHRLDLAVVTFGADPLAHDGARRAMKSKAARATADLAPPWMLASGGGALPAGPRALPIRIGILRRADAANLRAGCTCGHLRGRAVGLAATLRIAADDPYATEIDRARVVQAMTSGDTAAEIELRADLLDLAADLDDSTVGMTDPGPGCRRTAGAARRGASRGSDRPRRDSRSPGIAPMRTVFRHAADCACAALV